MSNPADIEVAGVPAWMAEDTPPPTTGGDNPSWMVEDSSAKASNKKIIHAPTRKATQTPVAPAPAPANITAVNIDGSSNNNNPTSAREAAAQKTWGQYFKESFTRDGRLLLITLAILICMNIPYVRYILYPFTIFSTWIHELCHGLAAIMTGGRIIKLEIFPDSSGLATTAINGSRRGFVASAGYQGTAFAGLFLLIFRRTKRGPRTGTMVIACTMILSCILWVRNWFGFVFLFIMGVVLAGLAWKIPSTHIRNLYIILAVTTSLNAITSVHDLFGLNQVVNGQPASTDAHTMADITGSSYLVWAILWFVLAIVLTLLGIVFAIPGPDEVADFACCGVCQDFGLFKPCNYPGQRWMSRIRGGGENNSAGGTNATAGAAGP